MYTSIYRNISIQSQDAQSRAVKTSVLLQGFTQIGWNHSQNGLV